jgi:hypothetical protein
MESAGKPVELWTMRPATRQNSSIPSKAMTILRDRPRLFRVDGLSFFDSPASWIHIRHTFNCETVQVNPNRGMAMLRVQYSNRPNPSLFEAKKSIGTLSRTVKFKIVNTADKTEAARPITTNNKVVLAAVCGKRNVLGESQDFWWSRRTPKKNNTRLIMATMPYSATEK